MKLDAVYIIHHTHTDVGYTIDQPIFWELQARFIDEALKLVDRYRDGPHDGAFRWTMESTCGLEAWLETASARDVERLLRAEKEGFIEASAMFANLTPLVDIAQLIESLEPVRRLRAQGMDIRFAMNCDVNGHNWPLADVLLDAGIEGFSMAINHHFGGAPVPRPSLFLWQAPSGRCLPAFNGWQYSKALDFGIGREDGTFEEWLPKIESYLDEVSFPVPFIALEGFHPFGDNGSAWDGFAKFALRWNEAGRKPRLICATPRMFWEEVNKHADRLPTWRGDWTDYWNFGAVSTARETAIALSGRNRLFRADALYAALNAVAPASQAACFAHRSHRLYRDTAWRQLNLYAEHTWGGDEASNNPETEDSLATECHKKSLAYTQRSLGILLERDALADFTRHVDHAGDGELLLFNPLPWSRTVSGPVAHNLLVRRGLPEDPSASRMDLGKGARPTDFWTGRASHVFNGNFGWMLPPTQVPAFGYAVVGAESLVDMASAEQSESGVVENARYRIAFDLTRGGIASLFDKKLGVNWIDAEAGFPFHGFVHEEVADHTHPAPRRLIGDMDWSTRVDSPRCWKPDWKARRTVPTSVVTHVVYRLPFATIVEQVLTHPKVGEIRQRVLVAQEADHLECQSEWLMGTDVHPEATYLAFPFALPGAQARFDVGVPVRPHADQLPGVNRDFFTVQGWIDFNDGKRGVTIATPENPLVQLGDFTFGKNQSRFSLERAMLLGWVTNNYWETNFPGRQPGVVTARYHILPYEGAFDASRSYRFAAEAAHARPTAHPWGEPPEEPMLPPTGSLLLLPEPPVMVLSVKVARDHSGVLITLFNASDLPQRARIAAGLIGVRSAELCDVFGTPQSDIALDAEQGAAVEIAAYQRVTVRVETILVQ